MEYLIPILVSILYSPIEGFSLLIPNEDSKTDLVYLSSMNPGELIHLRCKNQEGDFVYAMTATVESPNLNKNYPTAPIRRAVFDNFLENAPKECIVKSISQDNSKKGCEITRTTNFNTLYRYKLIYKENVLNLSNAFEQYCFKKTMKPNENMLEAIKTCDGKTYGNNHPVKNKIKLKESGILNTITKTQRFIDHGNKDERGRLCVCGESPSCPSFVGKPKPPIGWGDLARGLWNRYSDEAIKWGKIILQ